MRKFLPLILLIGLISSCSKNDGSKKDESVPVMIRLSNVSAFDYTNVKVGDASGLIEFGDLVKGQVSAYKEFEETYRNVYVELIANGKPIVAQPTDHVGEDLLTEGDYLLEITVEINGNYKKIHFNLIRE